MFMHHIALCTPYIALVIRGHLLHMRVDHAKSESEIQVKQVQWVFGGPQASSCEDTNIIVIKPSSSAFNHTPCLLSSILLYVLL
jgi:hypothetical protein